MELKLYKTLIIIISFIAGLVYYSLKKEHSVAAFNRPLQNIKDYHDYWLQEYEKCMWNFLEEHNITQEDYKKQQAAFIMTEDESDNPLITKTQQPCAKNLALVYRVCDDFKIDKNKISVVAFNDPTNKSPACEDDSTLFINEVVFNNLSEQAQLFVIGHELSHFTFKDSNFASTLDGLLPLYTHSSQHPANVINRFQELRADMNAAIKSQEYAQGLYDFLRSYLDHYGPGKGISHPTFSYRLAFAQPILEYYEINHNYRNNHIV